MATSIIRLFPTAEATEAALTDLRTHNFSNDDIAVVRPSAGATVEELTAKLEKQKIPKAKILALSIAGGATLVVVTAVFGTAVKAGALLDRNGPIASGINEPPPPPPVLWDPAAPFSSFAQFPILSKDPTPFSRWLMFPTLIASNFKFLSLFGIEVPEILPDRPSPLSRALGLAVLLKDPAPLSKLFNIPVLK